MTLEPSPFAVAAARPLGAGKFEDARLTAKGERRAQVAIERLETVWVNTGTLCNLACTSCYIESSPTNDALAYLSLAEAEAYFDEAAALGTRVIGFTGGEPFMNPDMIAMMRSALERGFELLVLTNAMRPMRRFEAQLRAIALEHGNRVVMRVSLDHHGRELHEAERGPGTWDKAIDGLKWLAAAGFRVAVAGRQTGGDAAARAGYGRLLSGIGVEAEHVVLFPTMDATADVPEITEACWGILNVSPAAMMCASSRMVVKAKGARRPHVVACTLLPYDDRFAMGEGLAESLRPVPLNHPHCARFCVLGGASCSG
ncbi:MAG TPA: radical SAM protein [Allosphingosinicella sp.]|nr:radical SAM protein [Allosphingosinicella sp.]